MMLVETLVYQNRAVDMHSIAYVTIGSIALVDSVKVTKPTSGNPME